MAENKKEEAKTESTAEGAEGAPKSKKKLIIIGVAGIVLLGGAIGGLIASGVLGGGEEKSESEEHADAGHGKEAKDKKAKPKLDEHGNPIVEKPVYYDMPDLIVNLNSPSPRPHFVNLKLTLELSSEPKVAEVEAQKPRIVDSFNTYLREVRREDMQGSAGVYRLENELQLRLNKILGEGVVTDILFREIIVQ